jgi:hypothetical protein
MNCIAEVIRKARKPHYCDGCNNLLSYDNFDNIIKNHPFTEDEIKILLNLKMKNYKILQGEKYMCQTNSWDGEIWNFKCNLDLWNLDKKYNLFEFDI